MQTSSDTSSSFHLLTLLLQCAELISTNHPAIATDLLPELFELSSPFGSPFHRVAAFFTLSLSSHLLLRHLHHPPPPPLLHHSLSFHLPSFHSALHSFNSLTPFIKFSHFTSNQAIFNALGAHHRLHVIDLDIMQGLQWPGLFHILSSNKLNSIRLTAFGPSSTLLAQTGTRLADFAHSLGLPFKYDPIEGRIGDMSNFIKQEHGEVTVVHCTNHRLYDVVGCEAESLMKVLHVVRPRLVTVVEQDLEVSQSGSNTSSFLEKFVDALHYYSALFDAVEEGLLGRDSVQRYEVERQLFGNEIRNILALDGRININGCGGVGRWGHELVRAGFEPFSLSGSPAAQAGLLLEMFPWKGYTLVEENGCLRLGWKGLSLLTASAWQPTSSNNFGDVVGRNDYFIEKLD